MPPAKIPHPITYPIHKVRRCLFTQSIHAERSNTNGIDSARKRPSSACCPRVDHLILQLEASPLHPHYKADISNTYSPPLHIPLLAAVDLHVCSFPTNTTYQRTQLQTHHSSNTRHIPTHPRDHQPILLSNHGQGGRSRLGQQGRLRQGERGQGYFDGH